MTTREFTDKDGRLWQALPLQSTVAHGKYGAALGFRPADEPDAEPLISRISFNSLEAAEFALRTLGEQELSRRLALARQTSERPYQVGARDTVEAGEGVAQGRVTIS